MAIATINPSTGETHATFPACDAAGIEQRLDRAQRAFALWSATAVAERARVVARAATLLDERRVQYGELMTLEMGKLRQAAMDEAAKCAMACRYYAEHGPSIVADRVIVSGDEQGYVAHHPIGAVLAVMPWNFPFWQVIRFAAPTLVAGNVALLKHASNVPQCALAIEQLFLDAGAPEGVFQALLIGSDRVGAVIADSRVAAVTLTGSEGAGSQVARAAGEHLKKTVLELGGSDPFIVMPSADLAKAVEVATRARMVNNGQSCIAAKRFIVHERVADEFEDRFVKAIAVLKVGDPMDPATQVGPLASRQLVDDLAKQVDESVARGARVLTGGRRMPGSGFFFEPTVLTNIPKGSPAWEDETFGPVASVFRVRDASEAVRIANDTRFGLGSSVWTTDPEEARFFARHVEAGSVFVNAMVASDPRFPFGGVKASGYGRELADIGLREFVNIKTVRMFGLGTLRPQDNAPTSE